MPSELVDILEKEASAERERILGEARARAEEIVAQGRHAAESYLDAQRREAEAERTAARTKAESAAQLQAASMVLQEKDQALATILTEAQTELARIPGDKGKWGQILKGLIREGAAGLSGPLVIEVHPDDLQAARQAAKELGLDAEVKASTAITGGARLATPDGRFVVENTLASRLERVRPVLASEVAALLWQ